MLLLLLLLLLLMYCLHEARLSPRPVAATSRRDRLPVVNTRGDCRGDDRRDDRCDDRRNRTGHRPSNPFADHRRYANYYYQLLKSKISLISGAWTPCAFTTGDRSRRSVAATIASCIQYIKVLVVAVVIVVNQLIHFTLSDKQEKNPVAKKTQHEKTRQLQRWRFYCVKQPTVVIKPFIY